MTGVLRHCWILLLLQATLADISCWQQKCHECSEGALANVGTNVKCSIDRIITEHWLDNSPPLPNSQPDRDVDYACIKMVASNPAINGDSTDIIRGCSLRITAETLCNRLTGFELARGKSTAKCYYCYGDSCNSAPNKNSWNALVVLTFAGITRLFY